MLDYLISKFGLQKMRKGQSENGPNVDTGGRHQKTHFQGLGTLGEAVWSTGTKVTSQTETKD